MIEVKEIIKSYGNSDNKIQVLKGISLKIKDGDFAVILGASGSGKSTFLNVVSGLEYPAKCCMTVRILQRFLIRN